MELVDDGATTAVWVGRPGDVVVRHAAPLELVGVEQVGFGPAPEDPRQLPAEIEPAGEREVHPGSAAWRDPVGRVSGEEGPAHAEPRGDLARRVKVTDAFDAHVDIGARTRTRIMAARASASSCISSAPGAYTQRSSTPAGRNAPGADGVVTE